jgi:hypothetical protein
MDQRPKEKVYKPAWFCIYCSDGRIKEATKRKLSAEHIIPFGLGGLQIFPRASCNKCAKITGAFEQTCLRMMFGPTRIRLGLPTRREHERPNELTLVLSHRNTPIEEKKIPASQFPLIIPGLLLPAPGVLAGEKPHDRMVGEFFAVHEKDMLNGFEDQKGFRIGTFNNHVFMQMLAKIAHSYAVAEWGFHSFRPLLRDLIIGGSQTPSYWVGGNGPVKQADPAGFHRLELKREMLLGTEYVVAYVRLFCSFGTPEYRVVVGTWNEGR